jgi:bifunctional DNA-binding transcriptional regulator/antitoxin component of YhaV-PrlF toxin-antitoxin module
MKNLDTMTVSRVGQSTLPKWWRDVSGLSNGGVVEVRPMRDGKNSIVLTPKPAKRHGAVGLLKLFGNCPVPIPAPERHRLPFK